MTDLKALVFCIRNLFDPKLHKFKVFLDGKQKQLSEPKDFKQIHKLLMPLNQAKSQNAFNQRKTKQRP